MAGITFEDLQRDILLFVTGALIALLIIGVDISHFARVFEPIS